MDQFTAKKIIQLNHVFYQTIGKFFDSSRNYSWPGWNKLANRISLLAVREREDLNILDLGCGNGRFAEFLYNELELKSFNYVGVEYSEYLIERAKVRIEKLMPRLSMTKFGCGDIIGTTPSIKHKKNIDFKLINCELVIEDWEKQLDKKNYNLITLFAVMHHIPSIELRKKLLNKVKNLMGKDSVFIVTFWKFKDVERLKKRILDKDGSEFKSVLNKFRIDKTELDSEDYILDWERGEKGFRYCHYFSSKDSAQLLEEVGFKIVDNFLDDGKEGFVNEYFVCVVK